MCQLFVQVLRGPLLTYYGAEYSAGSVGWFQEGTPVPPLWHPHSTVFNQLTLYPLVNLVPFHRQYQSHRYCGEPPRTHSLRSSPQLDTHKDTKASNT